MCPGQRRAKLSASVLWYPNTAAASWLQPWLLGLAEGWLNGFFANINMACNDHASCREGGQLPRQAALKGPPVTGCACWRRGGDVGDTSGASREPMQTARPTGQAHAQPARLAQLGGEARLLLA